MLCQLCLAGGRDECPVEDDGEGEGQHQGGGDAAQHPVAPARCIDLSHQQWPRHPRHAGRGGEQRQPERLQK